MIQPLREAMPFGVPPRTMFRDNDRIYGDEVGRFLVGTGIQEVITAYRSPWQNPFVERCLGTLRRELLDHVIISGGTALETTTQRIRRGVLPRCSAPSGTKGQHAICNESARGNERTRPLDFHSRFWWSASPVCSRGSLTPTLVFVCLPRTEVDYPSL